MIIDVRLGIGLAGVYRKDTITIDDEKLEGLTTGQKERLIYEYAEEWAYNYIEISVEESK